MILLIDNYDSFTYNLYQFIGIFESNIKVYRNDEITIEQIEKLNPDAIVISPGPKGPKEAGICVEVIRHFAKTKPILGICLGHQCIGEAFGGEIVAAKTIMHGKQSTITTNDSRLFRGLKKEFKVARYHSLAIKRETMPKDLEVTALSEDGEVMSVKLKNSRVYGVQFHPESIYTEYGKKIIENFLMEANIWF